jgi:5-oxoprolinase (ATP-hydrolysing)
MTDVEILERRYPVLCRVFALREGSGGEGEYCGGEGIHREIEFLRDGITATVLTERRSIGPKGLNGGSDGKTGRNLLFRKKLKADGAAANEDDVQMGGTGGADGTEGEDADEDAEEEYMVVNLGGKGKTKVKKGDIIQILTPGGGGFGAVPAGGSASKKPSVPPAQNYALGTRSASMALSSNNVDF